MEAPARFAPAFFASPAEVGSMFRNMRLCGCLFLLLWGAVGLPAAEPAGDLNKQYESSIRPLLATYCVGCHGKEKVEAELNLATFATAADVAKGHQTWQIVLERLEAGEMPPEDAKSKPSPDERKAMIAWIRDFRRSEAERTAGDPGPVLVRRLNGAELNYAIRDLTGVDIHPAREFPVDPANEAGFDNSGESLTMSPALLKKYVAAAREVAEHLVLTPSGIAFAPHPVMTDTDRDKYCVKRIVDFYQRQPTDYSAYFAAAWRYKHRADLGQPDATLESIATAEQVSPKYLATIWQTLEEPTEIGPIAKLQAMWRELPGSEREGGRESLPGPNSATEEDDFLQRLPTPVVRIVKQMRDFVVSLRRKLEPTFDDLEVAGIHKGSQTFVLWKNGQYASHRRKFAREVLQVAGEPLPEREGRGRRGKVRIEADPNLTVPADPAERAKHEAEFARFAATFPDAFYISERGRDYVGKSKDEQEKGRLLSAGFHSMMGYYRDDGPLCELILSDAEKSELDALWQELDFVTSAPMRQYTGFVWFERTDSRYMRDEEFDFARSEDKNVTSEEKVDRLGEVYLAKAKRGGAEPIHERAIEQFFKNINAQIRWVEQARLAAEPHHLQAILSLAERAYRRPLGQSEKDEIAGLYRSLRTDEQLSHEEAMQDTLVFVLLSPNFCYRLDLAAASDARRPLTDYELASRLSFFLWSSLPDEQLLRRASAGELKQPEVLAAEAKRMLQDERTRALAVEFGGNWLDFRRFESHNSVGRERFPAFTNELRQAMFEEPVRFFLDVAKHDRSVLDFLYGKQTLVNPILAKHYGIDLPDVGRPIGENEWVLVENAGEAGRGGLMPMSVFLTQNSPGLRTSPVKRGYWVVRRLLGERIPPPPPTVPELPADEAKLGDLTLREALERHRNHQACAGCHERFDSFGLVFEDYGPIGERREKDLGGRPVDTRASFPGGNEGTGLPGLREYLRQNREQDFVENLCRKLLSYALGRSLLPSDDKLVGQMQERLAARDHRFGELVSAIVTSEQFMTKRGTESQEKEISP
jgi:mono/diheme cytochrome c family protein